MSKHVKYVPKHRQDPAATRAKAAPMRALRTTVLFSSVAVAATGVAVSGGVLKAPVETSSAAADLNAVAATPLPASRLAERAEEVGVSRSEDRRAATDQAKKAALAQPEGPAITRTEDLSDDNPRDIARALLGEYGFSADQFSCLDSLYVSESNWRIAADNPPSSAYGIPQALTQLHDLPADYMTSAESQIRRGLGYIQDTYGTPCNAWSFKSGNGWY